MDQSPAARAPQVELKLVVDKQALLLAATNGITDNVRDYLDMGIPITTKDDEGNSLLHCAARGGHVTTMRLLIRRGCDVNSIDVCGLSPLHLAARNGQTKAVRELIRHGAFKSMVSGEFGTPLQQAALGGHVETVVAMVEEGCPIDAVNSNGATVLHCAAADGNAELVRELVGRGCDINAIDANGCTPLHSAANFDKTEAVQELIKLGAANSVFAGTLGTPLHVAARKGHNGTVGALLEKGCSVDEMGSAECTVLHSAAESGHVEVVRQLIDKGSDVNAVDTVGSTPLHYAAVNGRTETVRELIKYSTTDSVTSDMNTSQFSVALQCGREESEVAVLGNIPTLNDSSTMVSTDSLSSPPVSDCINRANYNGITPLMWTSGVGNVEMCRLLVAIGASITAKDKFGWMAFEHCLVGGHSSKLSQLCEACGIGCSGEGLKGALVALIARGLVDVRKVLCLCAISGDYGFLEDQFVDLAISNSCTLPMIVKYAKAHFTDRVTLMDELHLPADNALNPLHICLLALKVYKLGYAPYRTNTQGSTTHDLFISKLLSNPVLRATAHENFPNGLSPLDLARQFELHAIAAHIEKAGGRPGVWAKLPQSVFLSHRNDLFQIHSVLKSLCDVNHGGHQAVKEAVIALLGGQTADSAANRADGNHMMKEMIVHQHPDLGDVVKLFLPRIQVRHWKRVGLALGIKESTIDDLGQQFSDNDDRYLEILSYWLKHGSSVTWKTLLDVLGHFETKHTIDDLTDKIVSELGRAHQVSVQRIVLSKMLCGVLSGGSSVALQSFVCVEAVSSSSSQMVAMSDPFRPHVTRAAPVVGGGAVASERSQPVCEGELCGVKPMEI